MSEGQSKLEPCPHGKEALVLNIGGAHPFSIAVRPDHRCVNREVGWFAKRDQAIEAWNEMTRTVSPSPEQSGELATLPYRLRYEAEIGDGISQGMFDAAMQAADALESAQAEIARLTAALGEIKRGISREYDCAARLEKEHPDCRYREGIAEGVCDVMNYMTPILSAALKGNQP